MCFFYIVLGFMGRPWRLPKSDAPERGFTGSDFSGLHSKCWLLLFCPQILDLGRGAYNDIDTGSIECNIKQSK